MQKEKRVLRHYVIDKELFKLMAHKAIDDECDNADILESFLDIMMEQDVKEVVEIDSKNKCQKALRLHEKYWIFLDALCVNNNLSGGQVINAILYQFLQKRK